MDRVFAWQRANPDGFNWDYLGSPDAMKRLWRAADFTVDSDRYREATLPALPFADDHFALAVSGFLLFVYPELLSFDDHLRCLIELARVTSGEVRVFPLHSTQGTPYPRLPELRKALAVKGIATELRTAACSYDPHPGSDRMLVCRQA